MKLQLYYRQVLIYCTCSNCLDLKKKGENWDNANAIPMIVYIIFNLKKFEIFTTFSTQLSIKEKTMEMMEAEHQEFITKFEEKIEIALGLEETIRKLQDSVAIAHKEVTNLHLFLFFKFKSNYYLSEIF